MKRTLIVVSLLLSTLSLGAELTLVHLQKNPITVTEEYLGTEVWVTESGETWMSEVVEGEIIETKLGLLSRSQVKVLKGLVADSLKGEIVTPEPDGCRAVPKEEFIYTAADRELVLQEGTRPCGLTAFNNSPAASRLVELLNQIETIQPQQLARLLSR